MDETDVVRAGAYDVANGALVLVDITAHRAHLAFHAGDTIATFACHSAACRPPASGGTGGSLPGGAMSSGRVGTRSPKGGTGNTTLAFGEISPAALQAMVKRLHKVGALPKNITTADEAADYIAANVLKVYHQVTPENVAAWKEWYVGANHIGRDLSGPDLPHHAANAAIAVLSPGTHWDINVAQTRAVVKYLRENPALTKATAAKANTLALKAYESRHAAWAKSVENAKTDHATLTAAREKTTDPAMLKKIDGQLAAKADLMVKREPTLKDFPHFKEGQRPSEVPPFSTGFMLRATVKNAEVRVIKINPDGTYNDSEFAYTKKGKIVAANWQSYYNLAKVASVMRDPSMENIDKQLGSAHKVRAFFNNINDPHNPAGDVTVDTHAYGIGVDRPLSMSHPWISTSKGRNITGTPSSVADGTRGTYALFHEGYTRAAAAVGLEPREMQSVTWTQWREMHSVAERAANVKRITKGGAQ